MELKRGDVVVWIDNAGNNQDYFIITEDGTGRNFGARKILNNTRAFGWNVKSGQSYNLERNWLFDRKATQEEKEWFYDWIENNGHYVNINTLEFRD